MSTKCQNLGAMALCLLLACCSSERSGNGLDICPQESRLCKARDATGAELPPQNLLPPTHPCDFDVVGDGESKALSGLGYEVGEFTVVVESASLEVRHALAPARLLFDSSIATLLRAESREFLLEESQGSVSVHEELHADCHQFAIDHAASRDGLLVFGGRFLDGGTACGDLAVELRFCQPLPGHLKFEVELSPSSFNSVVLRGNLDAKERVFGLGEQFPQDSLDLRGRKIPLVVQEGGIGRGLEPTTTIVNAYSPGAGGSAESTYYPIPYFVTNLPRALFLETTAYSVFDFSVDGSFEIRLHGTKLIGRILHGSGPLELTERFTEYSGRMRAPPDWIHDGAIVALARPLDESASIVTELMEKGAAIAAVWNQTWSGTAETWMGEQVQWNWVLNREQHPDWDEFLAGLKQQDIRVLCYANPMLRNLTADGIPVERDLFQEAGDLDLFVHDQAGGTYMLPITAFDVGLLDLTNPATWTWMKGVLKEEMLEGAGCSGWMVDFGESLPFDAQLSSGVTPYSYHNTYPVDWIRLNREAVEEAGLEGETLLFNRSGYTRTAGESMLIWEGDQLTSWDQFDGLQSALHGLINGGFSGIAINHSDSGGYTSLSLGGEGGGRSAELLQRWVEMNAFTAALRTHEGNQPASNVQVYSDDEVMDHFVRFTKVYRALGEYRRTLIAEATSKGWPVVRHLAMHYPDDDVAWTVDDQFLLGEELLVAPIVAPCSGTAPCAATREVYLPAGEWVHLWSGATHGDAGAGAWATISSPVGEPPVFYRKGSAPGLALEGELLNQGIM